jgi:putative FmdB family regulatory protein
MPLFDYRCPACGYRFEALVRAAGPAPDCPHCGAAPEREISAPVAPARSQAIIASARRQAAREGHLSNYSKAERGRLLR